MEELSYYYGLKPSEFWNSSYKTVNKYIQANMARNMDDLRMEVNVQDAVSNKLIKADAMSTKHPKVVPLRDMFKDLFKKSL